MRRASTCLAVLGLGAAGPAGRRLGGCRPSSSKLKPCRFPGFPGTGNILGAGAALKAEYEIAGTEYGGFPPPVIGVNFYLPQRHRSCTRRASRPAPKATLEQFGPIKCPKGSRGRSDRARCSAS